MAPPVRDRVLGLDLLRTCRQIYSETALLPYSRNCYHFRHVSCFRSDIKRVKPFQRALISSIQLHAFTSEGLLGSPEEHQTAEKAARDHLQGVKQIHVLVVDMTLYGDDPTPIREQTCKKITEQLEQLFPNRKIVITFEFVKGMIGLYRSLHQ